MKYLASLICIIALLSSCASTQYHQEVQRLQSIDLVSVKLKFDISKEGKPVNIEVVESTSWLYDTTAKDDLSEWEYKPKVVNGSPVLQKGLTVQLDYRLR